MRGGGPVSTRNCSGDARAAQAQTVAAHDAPGGDRRVQGGASVSISSHSWRDDDVPATRNHVRVHGRCHGARDLRRGSGQGGRRCPGHAGRTRLDKLEAETMQHYQAVLRLDTRNPPGNEVRRRRVRQRRAREGRDRRAARRLRSEAAEPDRAAQGKRQKAAAPGDGAQRHRHHRRKEVDASAAERDARRRLRLRPRHDRRQGQPHRRADDDAAAQAAERAARPRRDLRLGSGRGRRLRRRHRLPGEGSLPGDRRGVLPRRRRRRHAHRRPGEVRHGADAREDPARHRAGLARHLRPRLDSAEVERDRPPGRRGRQGRRVAARRPLQRDHRHLLPQAGVDLAAGRREVLPRRAVERSESPARRRRLAARERAAAFARCCGRRCRRTSSPAAIART